MARIEIYRHAGQAQPMRASRVNPGIADAVYSGRAAVARAGAHTHWEGLGQIAATVNEQVQKLGGQIQEGRAYKAEKELDAKQRSLNDQMQEQMHRVPEEEWGHAWGKLYSDGMKDIEKSASWRGLSNMQKEKLRWKVRDFGEVTGFSVKQAGRARALDRAQKLGIESAFEHFKQGRAEHGEAEFGKLVEHGLVHADQAASYIRKGYSMMQGVQLDRELEGTRDMRAADRAGALRDQEERLQSGGEGMEHLTELDRLDRQRRVAAERRQVEAKIAGVGVRILEQIRKGEVGVEAVGMALESGAIDERTAELLGWDAESGQALAGGGVSEALRELAAQEEQARGAAISKARGVAADAEAKAAAEQLKLARDREKQAANLAGDISLPKGGTVGYADIEAQLLLGYITEEQARGLRAQVLEVLEADRRTSGEVTTGKRGSEVSVPVGYLSLDDRINELVKERFWGRRDASDSAYAQVAGWIVGAPLSKEARIELGDKLMQVRSIDLGDGVERAGEGGGDRRGVSEVEQRVRKEWADSLREAAGQLGPELLPKVFFNGEALVREFFDDLGDADPSEEQLLNFKMQMKERLGRALAGRVLSGVYGVGGQQVQGPQGAGGGARAAGDVYAGAVREHEESFRMWP